MCSPFRGTIFPYTLFYCSCFKILHKILYITLDTTVLGGMIPLVTHRTLYRGGMLLSWSLVSHIVINRINATEGTCQSLGNMSNAQPYTFHLGSFCVQYIFAPLPLIFPLDLLAADIDYAATLILFTGTSLTCFFVSSDDFICTVHDNCYRQDCVHQVPQITSLWTHYRNLPYYPLSLTLVGV